MAEHPIAGQARHRALADPSRARIVRLLRAEARPLDVHEVAAKVGLHPNTVRAHLDVLAEAELASKHAQDRTTPGRPRMVYEARPDPAEDAGDYRLLAEILSGYIRTVAPNPVRAAEDAGRAWGRYLTERPAPSASPSEKQAAERVASMLEHAGFEAEIRAEDGGTAIMLHHCPFREVALRNQDVVCSVHLGMIKGALATLGVPVRGTRLEPFVEPSLCIAHLRAAGA